jgi:hypothetical protein
LLKEQARGYPYSVATVPDAEWISQFEAARELRIGRYRIGALITIRQLVPVHNSRRQAGLSRESFEKQRSRRVGVGLPRRTWLFVTDAVALLADGL